MIDQNLFVSDCDAIRRQRPMVLCITNYVAMNLSANALLAVGASPLMSFFPDEMEELVSACDALCVNIGCLDSQQMDAMRRAVDAARRFRKPWVLDPVGVGASRVRQAICGELMQIHAPAVIRGNAAEVSVLASLGQATEGEAFAGLESFDDTEQRVTAAQNLSKECGSVVVVSGAVDQVVLENRVQGIAHGTPLMAKVTAMGCTASAMVAAYCAVQKDAFVAAQHAMLRMGLAGESAAQQAGGPGTFVPRFLDCLSSSEM